MGTWSYSQDILSAIISIYNTFAFVSWKDHLIELLSFVLRTSRSEFIVSVNKYLEAQNHKLSVGMRFKMRFEGEEVPERR